MGHLLYNLGDVSKKSMHKYPLTRAMQIMQNWNACINFDLIYGSRSIEHQISWVKDEWKFWL